MHPLRFIPQPKIRVWGGTVLSRQKGFSSPEPIGESWEICDHGPDVSIVSEGAEAETTLRELLQSRTADLAGEACDPASPDRFPLMLKLLDAQSDLSVQVHPDDAYANQQKPGELGKTEAWYIIDADPGACIYHGLKADISLAQLRTHLENGTVAMCLNKVPVTAGDVFFIPSGMVHALGAGIRMAEIQQNSDTTYRLFDWNRVGLDGTPREIHIEDSLAVIRLDAPSGKACTAEIISQIGATRERFITCDKFAFERLRNFTAAAPLCTNKKSFHILCVVSGSADILSEGRCMHLDAWECALIPACCDTYTVSATAEAQVLLFYVP